MFWKYLLIFFISMIPIIELRGSMLLATSGLSLFGHTFGLDLDPTLSLIVCVIGNMLPVPIIYFFARKFLLWGAKQRFIGKFCNFFVVKGEKAGQKLVSKAGRGGLFVALMLFVGIPIPGTGAWTGTLGASFLDMGFKSTVASVSLGVIIAGIIMGLGGISISNLLEWFINLF